MSWRDRASCRTLPLDYFFHDQYEVVPDLVREICEGCPVREDCLNLAIATDSIGIWAGTTTEQRRSMRRKPVKVAQHGTPSGYARHRKNSEQPCEPCRQARRTYLNDLRKRNKVAS